MSADAIFSPCRKYRYRLTRGTGDGPLWIMLNPSVADADTDDPTIRKVRGFTARLGFDSFTVVNLAAMVSTDPKAMFAALKRGEDVVGPHNIDHMKHAVERATHVVCAWGAGGEKLYGQIGHVDGLCWGAGKAPLNIGRCANGMPRHPLMVGYESGMKALGAVDLQERKP